jgi:hypothetical protein
MVEGQASPHAQWHGLYFSMRRKTTSISTLATHAAATNPGSWHMRQSSTETTQQRVPGQGSPQRMLPVFSAAVAPCLDLGTPTVLLYALCTAQVLEVPAKSGAQPPMRGGSPQQQGIAPAQADPMEPLLLHESKPASAHSLVQEETKGSQRARWAESDGTIDTAAPDCLAFQAGTCRPNMPPAINNIWGTAQVVGVVCLAQATPQQDLLCSSSGNFHHHSMPLHLTTQALACGACLRQQPHVCGP